MKFAALLILAMLIAGCGSYIPGFSDVAIAPLRAAEGLESVLYQIRHAGEAPQPIETPQPIVEQKQ